MSGASLSKLGASWGSLGLEDKEVFSQLLVAEAADRPRVGSQRAEQLQGPGGSQEPSSLASKPSRETRLPGKPRVTGCRLPRTPWSALHRPGSGGGRAS